jgi:hypothetical protein
MMCFLFGFHFVHRLCYCDVMCESFFCHKVDPTKRALLIGRGQRPAESGRGFEIGTDMAEDPETVAENGSGLQISGRGMRKNGREPQRTQNRRQTMAEDSESSAENGKGLQISGRGRQRTQ